MDQGYFICWSKPAIYTATFPQKNAGTWKSAEFIMKEWPIISLFSDQHVFLPLERNAKREVNKDLFSTAVPEAPIKKGKPENQNVKRRALPSTHWKSAFIIRNPQCFRQASEKKFLRWKSACPEENSDI